MSDTARRLGELEVDVQRAIDGGDWALAAALELAFRRLLAQHIETLGTAADTTALRQTLEAAAHRVARLIGEVAHHERRLVREATTIATGRRAAAAYESARGSPA